MTMKRIKKLLTIGLAVLLMLCMSISFSACDTSANSSCQHTYEWVGVSSFKVYFARDSYDYSGAGNHHIIVYKLLHGEECRN